MWLYIAFLLPFIQSADVVMHGRYVYLYILGIINFC